MNPKNPSLGSASRTWVLVTVAMGVFVALAVPGLRSNSGTCDELGAHVPAGILLWRTDGASGGLANPPLGQRLIGAGPILFGTADRPLDDSPLHLLPARVPVVVFGLATLLICGVFAGRAQGPRAAQLTWLVAALCPSLLAHAQLATLDVPVTAFSAAACWAAWTNARSGRAGHLVLCALAVGAAATTKFTGLHLIPALALASGLDAGSVRERVERTAWLLFAAVAGVVVVAWLVYGGGPAQFGLPASMVEGITQKWAHGHGGHWAYLAGRVSTDGFPQYFLVALAVKLPLATSLTAVYGAFVLMGPRPATDARGLGAYVIVPAVWILAAMSFVHRVDIGIRHVLPIFPAILALAGIGLADLSRRGRAGRAIVVVLFAWLGLAAIRISPDPLAYFQELAGGPEGGDRFLVDSNLDWGQDDARLRAWIGSDSVRVNPAHPVSGRVAASVNALHGILSRDDRRLRWLTALPVAHRVGHCWRIYDVDESRLREAARRAPVRALDYARWLEGVGRPSDALDVLTNHDLSLHPRYGSEWYSVRAEAYLAVGSLSLAMNDLARVDEPDLALELAYRAAEQAGASPNEWSPSLRRGIVGALARRGHGGEANDVCRRLFGHGLEDLHAPGTLDRASRWRELGREREALEIVGTLLSRDPTNEDALWLYGELVVRRKLGLTSYDLPPVDWSGLSKPGS